MPHRSPLSPQYNPNRNAPQVEEETVSCEKCGCPWMSLVEVTRFAKYHNLIPGQKPGPVGEVFWMFECAKCRHMKEPTVQFGPFDRTSKTYNNMLDAIESVDGEKI